jgi:hypothetical protein
MGIWHRFETLVLTKTVTIGANGETSFLTEIFDILLPDFF